MKTHPAKAVHTKQAQILFIEDGRVRNIGGHHHMAMVDMTESVQPIDAVQLNGVWYKLADATEADQFQAAWENPVRVAPGEAGHIDSAKFCTLQGVSEKALTPYSYDFNPSDAAFIAKVKDIVGETIPCDMAAAAGIQAALERAKDDVPAAQHPDLQSKNLTRRARAVFRRDVLPPVPEVKPRTLEELLRTHPLLDEIRRLGWDVGTSTLAGRLEAYAWRAIMTPLKQMTGTYVLDAGDDAEAAAVKLLTQVLDVVKRTDPVANGTPNIPPVPAITDAQWQCLMSLDAAMRLAPLEISEDCHAPAVSFVRRAGRLSIVFSRGYLRRLQISDNKPSGIA